MGRSPLRRSGNRPCTGRGVRWAGTIRVPAGAGRSTRSAAASSWIEESAIIVESEESGAVPGFSAGSIACGIKKGRKRDLTLIVSKTPAVVAGVFTRNRVKAAPLLLTMERVKGGRCGAVIINSGNANACTGKRGMRDAVRMAGEAAKALGVEPEEVLVASTGVIGEPLPVDRIIKGVPRLAKRVSSSLAGWRDAAEAIMTTDTFPKLVQEEGVICGTPISILGVAKGSGMIAPDMATMLAFFVTDAAIEQSELQSVLRSAVKRSFNRITVDGESSTNDTVLLLANGAAGNGRVRAGSSGLKQFSKMVERICVQLATLIVKDGEGATKFLEIRVKGAKSEGEAVKAARRIANSL
ncbi:MAG: bifunctional glutamate N-acetyltransferase/amino-acid acetyltransferase ArgJ, partial [Deltaproteobacteria bacterium]|nr:bifunctional glutamate N-acetyltransferase/amino-acid acetyltransferase ArgJ [Deltaproteobacteria bacterium]